MADADVGQLTRLREAIIAAECHGDVPFFAATLDDDAVVLPPDAAAREGKAACLSFMRDVLGALLAQYERELICDSAEIVIDGDLAFDRGSFTQMLRERETGVVIRERGHYLWVYARRAPGWKLARVIWNGGEDLQDVTFDVDVAEGGSIHD
jgi:ketosteroid isomerase-like protein